MNYRIPKTLDNSMRCLGIPLDTLIVFMMAWGSFVMFNLGLYGIPVGIFVANIFARFRSRAIIRKIIRLIYWYLPGEMNFIPGIQGHQRKLNMSLNEVNQKNIKLNYETPESKVSFLNINKQVVEHVDN